jgi:hypothetical protein
MLHVSMNCANIEYMYMISHRVKRVRLKESRVNFHLRLLSHRVG